MKFYLKYIKQSVNNLERLMRNQIEEFQGFNEIEIIKISIDTLMFQYSDIIMTDSILNLINYTCGPNIYFYYYQLHSPNLNHIIKSLKTIEYKWLTPSSIFIFNKNLTIENDELKYLLEESGVGYILYPVEFETKYIKITNPLSEIYQTSLYSDIEFHIRDKIFKVHKLILMATSEWFAVEIPKFQSEIIFEFDEDPELFKNLLDLIYGFEIPIMGLRTLEFIELIQFFLIKDINIDEIVKDVMINQQIESNEYIRLISRIYPYIPIDLIPYIKQNINPETDLSILSPDIQNLLRS